MKRFYLLDCNNFFVSCERVFNPKLIGKPVVVLSNNDGCAISRSNEAKALGIKMGAAAFECEAIFKKHNVHVYSSNFSLYADISARVMKTLAELATDIEVYSIDEAFIFVPNNQDEKYYIDYGQLIRSTIKQRTGIPVSIGIGPTKTLAKVANYLAKKNPEYNGVFDITNRSDTDHILAKIPVGEVWGVGYRYEKMLRSYGITSAGHLKYSQDAWIKKKMTIVGLKTMRELRGIPCIELIDEIPAKQSITVSRSFGRLVSNKNEVIEAISTYMVRAAQKLRNEKALASIVTVFVSTSRYHDTDYYYNSSSYECSIATSYTPHLLDAALICLDTVFITGLLYKKVGVMLSNLVPENQMQMNVYEPLPDIAKHKKVMTACDKINSRWGQYILTYASAGINQSWKAKRLKKSAHYTTSWHELFTIEID